MEITKMLTISTAHVEPNTLDMLDNEPEANRWSYLGVYPKAEYGHFIYINRNELQKELDNASANETKVDIPEDLLNAIQFACDHDCDILCMDCDGEEVEELRTYW